MIGDTSVQRPARDAGLVTDEDVEVAWQRYFDADGLVDAGTPAAMRAALEAYGARLLARHGRDVVSDTRDRLFELLGQSAARRDAWQREQDAVADLIAGRAVILGARVRLEWVDPKPAWADGWLAEHDRARP